MTTEMISDERTYGGWRRQRGLGLYGLTSIELLAVGAASAALVFSFGWVRPLLWPSLAIFIVCVSLVSRIEGTPMWVYLHREIALLVSRFTKRGRFVSPLLTHAGDPNADPLPGFLAPTETWDVSPTAAHDSEFGIVWNRNSGRATVTFLGHSQSPHLIDAAELDVSVAAWHGFLASLGMIDIIDHVAITVSTATEKGSAVVDDMQARVSDTAPDFAKRTATTLQERERGGTPVTETKVSVTFDTNRGREWRKSTPERLQAVSNQVSALARDLRNCGLSSLRLATSAELSAIMRGAFTPNLRPDLSERRRSHQHDLLDWRHAGPTHTVSRRSYYLHDDAVTVGWVLGEAPRSTVSAKVLYDLLKPGPYPKRVTLLWKPTPSAKAAEILERERNRGMIRQRLQNRNAVDETARDALDREAADRAAAAEAQGSGLGDFTFVCTTTLELGATIEEGSENFDQLLRAARADMEQAAMASRLLLRESHGFHDLALWTGIGAGVSVLDAARGWLR